MKKFLSGALCTTLVFSLALSALAISGNVSFNLSAIKFDGVVISEAGDGYTLPNGCVAPASITYTDEKGGGTTYLPVRRIGELAGVTIDWDGAVVVKSKEFAEQEKREAEWAAALDYSDWSAEDEAAYQEFKGLWEILDCGPARESIVSGKRTWFDAMPRTDEKTAQQIIDEVPTEIFDKYNERWMLELKQDFGVILSYVERPTDDKTKVGKAIFYCSIFEDGTIWLGHD